MIHKWLTCPLFTQLTEMNGKMISGKPLYVAFAQRKEDRKAMLQVLFLNNPSFFCNTVKILLLNNLEVVLLINIDHTVDRHIK